MLACEPARFVYKDMYDVDPGLGSLLPADPDGSTWPAHGSRHPARHGGDGAPDELSLWSGTIDWRRAVAGRHPRPGSRRLRSAPTSAVGSWNCIPQPGTRVGWSRFDRLMHRLAYRNFGGWQSMVVDHTVNAGSNRAGVRWYELADQGGGWGSTRGDVRP